MEIEFSPLQCSYCHLVVGEVEMEFSPFRALTRVIPGLPHISCLLVEMEFSPFRALTPAYHRAVPKILADGGNGV